MSFKIEYNGISKTFDEKVSLFELLDDKEDRSIICARVNNRLRELNYYIANDSKVEFMTVKDTDAARIYEASLRFVVVMAFFNIYPNVKIRFHRNVSRSTYIEVLDKSFYVNASVKQKIEEEMKRIIEADYPLVRHKFTKEEAISKYEKWGLIDKLEALKYRPEKTIHLYECNGYYNYMFSRLVPSTGYLKNFNLMLYVPGLILQSPRGECDGDIPDFVDAPIYGKNLKKALIWSKQVGVDTVVKINEHIENSSPNEFIQLCEAKHNRMLAELGEKIEENIEDVRIICVAGPSSSGKTTFANRLRIELMSRGYNPIRISLDDYYKTKDEIPNDENGEKDLETIEALDIDLFNKNMLDLINGEEVELPKFDFKVGHRVPGRKLQIGPTDLIIIEGIHALNDRMTTLIPRHQKFKIFIAPQAQLNLDNTYPISTVDLRLVRRLVRDYKFRNAAAEETFQMWPSVRRGEFRWIYETQENADYVFNSWLPYELCVMKKYAMPLLEAVEIESPYFPAAERILRLLKYFSDMPDEDVPNNSLMREFIGGSCYADA